MAKTHGRAPLPLPESLQQALETLGYLRVNPDGWEAPIFRQVDHPELYVEVATGNIPGDDAVIARIPGQRAERMRTDLLIAKLTLQLHTAASPTQPMPKGPTFQ